MQLRNRSARTHLLALCKASAAPACSVGKAGCAAVEGGNGCGQPWALPLEVASFFWSALQLWHQTFLDLPSPGGGTGVSPCSYEMAVGAQGPSLVPKWNTGRSGAPVESYRSRIPPLRWGVLHSGECTSSALG